MTLLEYDAYTSGMSMPAGVQGFDAATAAVPVSSGVNDAQPAGATAMATAIPGGVRTNGRPLMDGSLLGQPHKWWLILVGLWFGLHWLAKKYNVPRFTILQSVIAVLQYVVVIVALKVILTKWTIPGLSPIVLNA